MIRFRSGRRGALAGLVVLVGLGGALFARDDFWRAPKVETPSFPYSGGFIFARIKFEPTQWGGGPSCGIWISSGTTTIRTPNGTSPGSSRK